MSLIKTRIILKNKIHGILLQGGTKIFGATFQHAYNAKLRSLKDYRINGYLDSIGFIRHKDCRFKHQSAQRILLKDAVLHKTIPGIGDFISFILAAEIDGIGRFSESKRLKSYAGLTTQVRNSADMVHHGHITERGSRMMRWSLVEAVATHVRFVSDSNISEFYRRLSKKRGVSKAKLQRRPRCLTSYFVC